MGPCLLQGIISTTFAISVSRMRKKNKIFLMLLKTIQHIDGLMQERCNSSALAMELHLSCNNPSILRVNTSSRIP